MDVPPRGFVRAEPFKRSDVAAEERPTPEISTPLSTASRMRRALGSPGTRRFLRLDSNPPPLMLRLDLAEADRPTPRPAKADPRSRGDRLAFYRCEKKSPDLRSPGVVVSQSEVAGPTRLELATSGVTGVPVPGQRHLPQRIGRFANEFPRGGDAHGAAAGLRGAARFRAAGSDARCSSHHV
jgi:hypothetical protein